MTTQPLKILVIADGKPGHENQSMGLTQAISQHTNTAVTKVAPLPHMQSMASLSVNKPPKLWEGIETPDLIIATGAGTQLSLIAAKHHFGSYSIVLSGPSFPEKLFDLCVIPEHDGRAARDNVIFTQGVLNKVQPSKQSDPKQGLILVGGESKHYHWNSDHIAQQIRYVANKFPTIQWLATNSRRTPKNFTLNAIGNNVKFTPWENTDPNWLPEKIANAAQIWVTPDSVSMVYESLTSGSAVYLFDLEGRDTKVSNSIENLRLSQAGCMKEGAIREPRSNTKLWEADRIAKIILEKIGR